MTITIEQARSAKKAFQKQLAADFNPAASPVNGIGLGRDDAGYYVSVGLIRDPSPAERQKLPETCGGVSVKYHKTGPVVAY